MATKISWCDETINPIVGCSKASPGCANCYAEPMARRLASMGEDRAGGFPLWHPTFPQYVEVVTGGRWNGKTAFVPSELDKPYKWKKPRSIFVGSMGDVFHESVNPFWLNAIMKTVAQCGQHTFIMLTKRPERMREYMNRTVDPKQPLPNLVLGVSAENQEQFDARVRILRTTTAAKIFVSIEPMVGPINMDLGCVRCGHLTDAECPGSGRACNMIRPLDGVILGGESGAKGRRLDPAWVISVRDQCAAAGVCFMFKQWSHENRNEVDPATGFPLLQDNRTHTALPWSVR